MTLGFVWSRRSRPNDGWRRLDEVQKASQRHLHCRRTWVNTTQLRKKPQMPAEVCSEAGFEHKLQHHQVPRLLDDLLHIVVPSKMRPTFQRWDNIPHLVSLYASTFITAVSRGLCLPLRSWLTHCSTLFQIQIGKMKNQANLTSVRPLSVFW